MNLISLLYQNGQDIVRTLLVGALAYAGLVLLLRLSGKRTLSKMTGLTTRIDAAYLGRRFPLRTQDRVR